MFRSSTNVVVAALFLAACSALKPTDPDLTPINATAVLETHMVNAGIPDFPAFDRTTLSYTRANVQRIESSLKGSGPISRFVDVETDTRIERLDRNLAWALHAKSKQVTECPLKGCPAPIPGKLPTKKPAGDDKTRDPACRLKIGNTTFTVEPTGQKRSINGFDTDTERMGVLPPEVGRMIGSYLSANVGPADRANFLAGAKKPDRVKGQPILMNVKWSFAGEACSMDETMKDIGDKPLFTFTSEVKSHRMAPLHDSLFAPPKGYKITK